MAETSIEKLQEAVTSQKAKLLGWERRFKEKHNRKPTIEDVQSRPDVEKCYLYYNRLKKKLQEAETTKPSPQRVEFVHSPSHPRSPHNNLMRTSQRNVTEYRPRPLLFTNAKPKPKVQEEDEDEGDVPEELANEAFWLDISVSELRRRKESGQASQQTEESSVEQQDEKQTKGSEDTLDDLFNDQPGNENWVNAEGLGPLAAYTKKNTQRPQKRRLQDDRLKEGRRKMRAMMDAYLPRNYDTLTPALLAERQAKRDTDQEKETDKPLQLVAATTLDGADDFIMSRRTYAPLVQSTDTGLLRNNPERRARLREQLAAGTLGMPKPKPSPPESPASSAPDLDKVATPTATAVN
ncbi:hypothetical protein BJV82DRAFT_151577 [Fennellomyces sp. T-0311]|nr:hypothetical protein BJV82DRAFT_151577 [Fennellomyces sp. T-0311]